MAYFSEAKWDTEIQRPDWYLGTLWDEYTTLMHTAQEDESQRDNIKQAVRGYFVNRIAKDMVALAAEQQYDLDAQREPIDSVVIHHTSGAAERYTLEYLNVVHMLQIYAPYFRNPTPDEASLKGKPLGSDHFYEGRQVFWGYHWFIDQAGRAKRILPDAAIGWQAGNWDVNKHSVAICFAGNFMEQQPNEAMLSATRTIIAEHYGAAQIIPHSSVNPKTACPGETFSSWQALLHPGRT